MTLRKTVRRTVSFFIAPLLLACSSASNAPNAPNAPLPPSTSSTSSTPSPPIVVVAAPSAPELPPPTPPPVPRPPMVPLPPTVELGLPVACVFDAERISDALRVMELALVPGGKPFVRVVDGAAHLSIPTGLASDTLLEIRDGGLILRGHTQASSIVLRPKAPFVLNGFAIPNIYATLSYTESVAGSMTVTLEPPAELEVFGKTLKGTRPCTDLGLERGRFDESKAIPGIDEKKPSETKRIEGGQKVDLRIDPNGKPVARLLVRNTELVFVSRTAGGMSRISLVVDSVMVFGWVKSSELKEFAPLPGARSALGGIAIRDLESPILERVRCDAEIPLMAEANGERKLVGSIRENTIIEVLAKTETEARVWVKSQAIHPAKDAELRVRAVDLYECKPVVTP